MSKVNVAKLVETIGQWSNIEGMETSKRGLNLDHLKLITAIDGDPGQRASWYYAKVDLRTSNAGILLRQLVKAEYVTRYLDGKPIACDVSYTREQAHKMGKRLRYRLSNYGQGFLDDLGSCVR